MHRYNNQPAQKNFRGKLRKSLTPAEAKLWNHLKNEQLGVKFRRQHSVANYFLDFYCPARKLAIELDGSPHDTEQGYIKDQKRTDFINSLGIKVTRFENKDVLKNLEGVLQEIRTHLF